MPFHRKSALLSLFNPPLPNSTLYDMLRDRRIPPPDAYNGRTRAVGATKPSRPSSSA